jgi:catechol 2,3-dioxygenase
LSFDILRAGHVEYLVTNLQRARRFYVDTLGFVETESNDHQVFLRGLEDRFHHCLVLSESDSPGMGHMAFRMRSRDDLERIESFLRVQGLRPTTVEDEEKGIDRSVRVQDSFGFPIEFYSEMQNADWMLRRFDTYRGAKVMRLDHFNIMLPDVAKAFDWYHKKLGFACTELTETEDSPPQLWAAWLRRKHTCHDIALTTGRGPRLHHAGFTVADRSNILDCVDLLAASGYLSCIERGPGRHGISNAFFLYLRDPDGNRIELYTGDYLSVEPDLEPLKWKLNDPQRQTFWGGPTPKSWFNEAMQVKNFETGVFHPLTDPKIVDRPDYLLQKDQAIS